MRSQKCCDEAIDGSLSSSVVRYESSDQIPRPCLTSVAQVEKKKKTKGVSVRSNYTIYKKLEVIQTYEEKLLDTSISDPMEWTSMHYNISCSDISKWVKIKEKLQSQVKNADGTVAKQSKKGFSKRINSSDKRKGRYA